MSGIQLKDARREGIKLLKDISNDSFVLSQTPILDCDCILSFVFDITKEYIFSHPEFEISIEKYNYFIDCIKKRCLGLPVAYITSKKEFYGLDFYVTPDVLIPKYDTEILVDNAITEILNYINIHNRKVKILDLCTGSGCIAVSVYNSFVKKGLQDKIEFYASDISEKALKIAKKNANTYNCSIQFIQSDLLDFFIPDYKEYFDFILTNPPYVPLTVTMDLLKDGRNEPIFALNGDCNGSIDGTGIIQRLIPQAYSILRKDGMVLMETGEYNIETCAKFLDKSFFYDIQILKDFSDMQRVIKACKK